MRAGATRISAAAGIVLMAIAACVGEDATPGADSRVDGGPADGTEGGRCFGNQSCVGDLMCSASNLCVRLTSPTEGGPGPGPGPDAGGAGPSDGGVDADGAVATPCLPEAGSSVRIPCPQAPNDSCTARTEACCPRECISVGDGGGLCANPEGGTDLAEPITCTMAAHCSAGRCCLLGNLDDNVSTCPSTGTVASTLCQSSCSTTLCANDDECPVDTTCRRTELTYRNLVKIPVGVCVSR